MKRLVLMVFLIFTLFNIGCNKKRPLPPLPPPPITEQADHLFDNGEFSAAAVEYEEVLNNPNLASSEVDRVRYRLGLIFANPGLDSYDTQRALEYLKPELGTETLTDSSEVVQSETAILIALLEKLNSVQEDLETQKKDLDRVSEELKKLKAVDKERRKSKTP